MKIKMIYLINLLIASILISCASSITEADSTKTVDKKGYPKECSKTYYYKNEFINLETLESMDIGGLPETDFKVCSKYAHRFENKFSDTLQINGSQITIICDNKKEIYQLQILNNKKELNKIELPIEKPIPEVHEYSFSLFEFEGSIIVMFSDFYATHYTFCKYNLSGKELMKTTMEHTYVTHPEPNTNHHHPYLGFHSFTATKMIFTTHTFGDKNVTRLLDLNDFTVKEYNEVAHGIILDENDKELIGFVTSKKDYEGKKQPSTYNITMVDGKKYSFSINYGSQACEFLLSGDLLYIANYHPIATGSSLHCFDLKAGKMKWTADVLQVNASHSQYWNQVTLSMYKNKIIMQGDEAYGSYLQFFDAESGKRLKQFGLLEIKK